VRAMIIRVILGVATTKGAKMVSLDSWQEWWDMQCATANLSEDDEHDYDPREDTMWDGFADAAGDL